MDERIAVSVARRIARDALAAAGLDDPGREARALVAFVAGIPAAEVPVSSKTLSAAALRDALTRRAGREPMAYISGSREFFGLEFAVSPATLIPRPDSEILVEAARRHLGEAPGMVLDLGTGTGCLLLSVLHGRPALKGVGTDRAPAAVALAHRNARTLGLAGRARLFAGDWFAAIDPAARFDCILANPPYIAGGDLAGLMPDVGFEPRLALDGGPDGADAYRALAAPVARHLAPGGVAVVEVGLGQAALVRALFEEQGLAVQFEPDLSGIPRAAVARARAKENPFGSAPGHR